MTEFEPQVNINKDLIRAITTDIIDGVYTNQEDRPDPEIQGIVKDENGVPILREDQEDLAWDERKTNF